MRPTQSRVVHVHQNYNKQNHELKTKLLLASLLPQSFVAVCSARDEDLVLFGAARRGAASLGLFPCRRRPVMQQLTMTCSPRDNGVLSPAAAAVVHASCASSSLWMERRRSRAGSSLFVLRVPHTQAHQNDGSIGLNMIKDLICCTASVCVASSIVCTHCTNTGDPPKSPDP